MAGGVELEGHAQECQMREADFDFGDAEVLFQRSTHHNNGKENQTRQFRMRVAKCVFTERGVITAVETEDSLYLIIAMFPKLSRPHLAPDCDTGLGVGRRDWKCRTVSGITFQTWENRERRTRSYRCR